MKSKLKALYFVLAALLILGSLGGCSWFGSGSKEGEGLSEADLNAQREGRFGEGGIPKAEGEGMFRDIGFDYDSASMNDQARMDVEYNLEVLKQNPELTVQLEGHCDERGTAEYNLSLGAERARAVKDVLLSFGLPASRMETISYGEEVPLDPGHSE